MIKLKNLLAMLKSSSLMFYGLVGSKTTEVTFSLFDYPQNKNVS